MRTIYFITGTQHRGPEAIAALKAAKEGDEAVLEREPMNQHDPNAVRVIVAGVCVGFVPARMVAKGLAAHIDANGAPPVGEQLGPRISGRLVATADRGLCVEIEEPKS